MISSIAFANLIASNRRKILAIARNFTGCEEDAEDLTQDVIIKAIKNEDKFDGSNLMAWLHTITRNTFLSEYQRQQRRGGKALDIQDEVFGDGLLSFSTMQTAEPEMEVDRIKEALKKVSDRVRICLELRIEGYKYEEIAEKVGVPIGTVKNRIHIAREELEYHLKKTKQPMSTSGNEQWVRRLSYKTVSDSVLIKLSMLPDPKKGIVIKVGELSKRHGVSEVVTTYILKGLTNEGYLNREREEGRGNAYRYFLIKDFANLAEDDIRKMAALASKPKATKEVANPQAAETFRRIADRKGKEIPPDAPALENPFGYFKDGEFSWRDSKQAAIDEALRKLGPTEEIIIVQRIGKVVARPVFQEV
jgi:RNA polymerase sigma factor (sigma-70 family)